MPVGELAHAPKRTRSPTVHTACGCHAKPKQHKSSANRTLLCGKVKPLDPLLSRGRAQSFASRVVAAPHSLSPCMQPVARYICLPPAKPCAQYMGCVPNEYPGQEGRILTWALDAAEASLWASVSRLHLRLHNDDPWHPRRHHSPSADRSHPRHQHARILDPCVASPNLPLLVPSDCQA